MCVDLKELSREIFREQRRYNNTIKALALQVESRAGSSDLLFLQLSRSAV
jgi:hypothetical protein